jgi:hypothetical protein
MPRTAQLLLVCLTLCAIAAPAAFADNVVADDQIVQGGLCAGVDCADGENFGGSQLKLKENNPRLLFEDSSDPANFPSNDWMLLANDTTNAGLNRFSLQDVTGTKTPFTVVAGAPDNALYVAPTGNVGFGTASPGLGLEVKRNNTPALRLNQDNSGGFGAQTWDVGGNETNFFVRDQTGGSHLPFRIRPGAPTSSVDISADGDVGMGTQAPASSLHIQRADGSAKLEVEETNGTADSRVLADLINDGAPLLRFKNTASGGATWLSGESGGDFTIKPEGGGDALSVTGSGDVSTSGALQSEADPGATEQSSPVDANQLLDGVKALPVTSWQYTADPQHARHIGPSGADFRSAFGVGASDGAIAPADEAGVALVAIGALDGDVTGLAGRVGALEAGTPGNQSALTALQNADKGTAKKIRALQKSNKKLSKRLKAVEKKLKKKRRR